MTSTQKDLLRFLVKRLRAYHHEWLAYRTTLAIYRDLVPGVDATLENALRSEDVQKETDRQLEGLEALIEHSGEESQETAAQEWLRQHPIPGPIN